MAAIADEEKCIDCGSCISVIALLAGFLELVYYVAKITIFYNGRGERYAKKRWNGTDRIRANDGTKSRILQ